MPHPYATGIVILAIIWILCFEGRKDMRRAMLWSSSAYLLVQAIVFVVLRAFDTYIYDLGEAVVPGYWNPETYLDLARFTGGYSIEDAAFCFFVGGIAAFLYEFTLGQRVVQSRSRKHHIRALVLGLAGAIVLGAFFQPNPIYLIITFGLVGAASIWVERPDLIPHSFWGGTIFATLYVGLFAMFLRLVPDLVATQYNLATLSGYYLLDVPLEELLYAFSFGALWAPLYEYEHGLKTRPT
jgi:hypothetical protein